MDLASPLAQEWQVLQHAHERYESLALWVRLGAIALCFLSLTVVVDLLLAGALIVVLWLQEAILRTSQERLGHRLLALESLYARDPEQNAPAFQLHTWWNARRGASAALLAEYARSAARPTVAFIYVVLLLIQLAALSTPVN